MANPKVFVTSDTHFGHRKIIEFYKEERPYATIEEHDRDLVDRWNAVVRKEDTVWHLGDVYFGRDGHQILSALKGYKRLVLGNHDAGHEDVLRTYFQRIYGVAQYGGCVLTHVPVHPYQLAKRYVKNIHGHMHSKRVQRGDSKFGLPGDDPDERYVCVSVEHTDLTPVLLQHVVQHGL